MQQKIRIWLQSILIYQSALNPKTNGLRIGERRHASFRSIPVSAFLKRTQTRKSLSSSSTAMADMWRMDSLSTTISERAARPCIARLKVDAIRWPFAFCSQHRRRIVLQISMLCRSFIVYDPNCGATRPLTN